MELWTAGQMVLTPPSSIMVQVVEVPFKRKNNNKKKNQKEQPLSCTEEWRVRKNKKCSWTLRQYWPRQEWDSWILKTWSAASAAGLPAQTLHLIIIIFFLFCWIFISNWALIGHIILSPELGGPPGEWGGPFSKSQDDKALKRTMRGVGLFPLRGGGGRLLGSKLLKRTAELRVPPSLSMYSPLPPAPRPDWPSHFFVCFKIF